MNIEYLYLKQEELMDKEVEVSGWVKSNRNQKHFGFIELRDGTCFKTCQLVYEDDLKDFDFISNIKLGSAIIAKGKVVKSPKEQQAFEIKLTSVSLEGDCPSDYPLQPKNHSREFLREIAYLRPRANLFQAVFRIRSTASFAIHKFFQEKGFIYVNTPLITANDGEGAGEMFRVTTLDIEDQKTKIDYSKDFFGKKVGLTVTGQLEGETFAMAFKNIYTFGPTFRAENSNTKLHAAEFWMVEPEMAFCDLNGLMDMEEEMLKYVIKYVLDNCKDEMEFCNNFVEKGLIDKLTSVLNSTAKRITYEEAMNKLIEVKDIFSETPEYGMDIGSEYEKYLTNELYKAPVFITDWPKEMKAFYMKQNSDNKTVAAVDLVVPGAGELMGGSERETDYDKLVTRMNELNIKTEPLDWYINLRKYGGVTHSGFGMGFERLIIYLTGVENIRDVIAYPRTAGNCEY